MPHVQPYSVGEEPLQRALVDPARRLALRDGAVVPRRVDVGTRVSERRHLLERRALALRPDEVVGCALEGLQHPVEPVTLVSQVVNGGLPRLVRGAWDDADAEVDQLRERPRLRSADGGRDVGGLGHERVLSWRTRGEDGVTPGSASPRVVLWCGLRHRDGPVAEVGSVHPELRHDLVGEDLELALPMLDVDHPEVEQPHDVVDRAARSASSPSDA